MTILTAVDGETTPSGAVEQGAELASVFGVDHVVLHVMPQSVCEELRKSTSESSGRSVTTPASYGGSNSPANAEGYTIENGERHATGVARDVVHGTLDDHSEVVLAGRVGDPVEEILAEADSRSVQYLVIGGESGHRWGRPPSGARRN